MFHQDKLFKMMLRFAVAPSVLSLVFTPSPLAAQSMDVHTFQMTVNAGAKQCVPNATATVSIIPTGQVEIMEVLVSGLPPDTGFDFFVIQVPKAPFGVAWYQGDIQTDKHGRGRATFVGRFSVE